LLARILLSGSSAYVRMNKLLKGVAVAMISSVPSKLNRMVPPIDAGFRDGPDEDDLEKVIVRCVARNRLRGHRACQEEQCNCQGSNGAEPSSHLNKPRAARTNRAQQVIPM
jgi:hypothetical protein